MYILTTILTLCATYSLFLVNKNLKKKSAQETQKEPNPPKNTLQDSRINISSISEEEATLLARNSSDIHLLSEIVKSRYALARCAAASNMNTSSEALSILASDLFSTVRLVVCFNRNLSRTDLKRLSNDESEMVASAAKDRLAKRFPKKPNLNDLIGY